MKREQENAWYAELPRQGWIEERVRQHCQNVTDSVRKALAELRRHSSLWAEFERRANLVASHFADGEQLQAFKQFVSELRRLDSITELAPARVELTHADPKVGFPNQRPPVDCYEASLLNGAVEKAIELVRKGRETPAMESLLSAAETLRRTLPSLCQKSYDNGTDQLQLLKAIDRDGYTKDGDLILLANAVESLERDALGDASCDELQPPRMLELNGQSASDAARAGSEWSRPLSPKQLTKSYGRSWDVLKRMIDDGKIRAKKLSTKSYLVHIEDLPTEET